MNNNEFANRLIKQLVRVCHQLVNWLIHHPHLPNHGGRKVGSWCAMQRCLAQNTQILRDSIMNHDEHHENHKLLKRFVVPEYPKWHLNRFCDDAGNTSRNMQTRLFAMIIYTILPYLIALRNLGCCHRLVQSSCFACGKYFYGLHAFSETFWSAVLRTKHGRSCHVRSDF